MGPTLFVTAFPPERSGGRGLRTVAVVSALARRELVEILFVDRDAPRRSSSRSVVVLGLPATRVTPSRGLRRLGAYVRARLRGVIDPWARAMSPELLAAVSETTASGRYGRVIADAPEAAAALTLAGRQPFIYNAHNYEAARTDLLGRRRGIRALEACERGILESAEESWMVSEVDMKRAAALAPRAELRLVPNALDVHALEPVEPVPGSAQVLFVADFTYRPNRAGLDFLVERVMPLIWEEEEAARLAVAGRGLEDWRPPDPRVEALGFVSDLRSAYARSECAVVPLLAGSGTPLKFIEALAFGVPVVATPRAAAGLEVEAGRHYVEGYDTEGFASAVVAVLRGGGAAVAREGRLLAEQRYSIEAIEPLVAPAGREAQVT